MLLLCPCQLLFQSGDLLTKLVRFGIPDLRALIFRRNDILGGGYDQLHRLKLRLQRVVFGGKRFIISDLGVDRVLGIGKRGLHRRQSGGHIFLFLLQNAHSLLLQRECDLGSGESLLRYIEIRQLLHTLGVVLPFREQFLVSALFRRQMLHHGIDLGESVQILTSQFFAKSLIFSQLLAFVLNFTLILSAFRFPLLVLLCDILCDSCDIMIYVALMISSDRRSETDFFCCAHE